MPQVTPVQSEEEQPLAFSPSIPPWPTTGCACARYACSRAGVFRSPGLFCLSVCPVGKGVGCPCLSFLLRFPEDMRLGEMLVLLASEQTKVLIWSKGEGVTAKRGPRHCSAHVSSFREISRRKFIPLVCFSWCWRNWFKNFFSFGLFFILEEILTTTLALKENWIFV